MATLFASGALCTATAASHRGKGTGMRPAGVFATAFQPSSVRKNERAKGEARRGERASSRAGGESGLRGLGEREWLGDVALDQRVRELPLAAHDLEAVGLELGGARAVVPKRLAFRDQLAKPFRELLDLHAESFALRARLGHAAVRRLVVW